MVGPFVLFDQMGPAVFDTGQGFDMGPHPHIGLAAVTYLIDGEIVHRDSFGKVQTLRPGEVSWVTAGSGIVYSERTPTEARASGSNFSAFRPGLPFLAGMRKPPPILSITVSRRYRGRVPEASNSL
jgi:redox-sensitive bicupin YhaK (pirin superfamily)